MTAPKISRPILRMVIEQDGQLLEYTVQTDNRDAVAFDVMRPRMRWPDAEAAPMLWMTVCGWSALRRSGQLAGVAVDKFLTDVCVDVEAVDEDGNPIKMREPGEPPTEAEAADPSQPGPEPG